MKKELELLAPLVDALQQFCSALEKGDADATDRMIADAEGMWPEIPSIKLKGAEGDDHPVSSAEARCDLLAIVADVGSVAETLRAEDRPRPTLAWCRANLIIDLEHFKASNSQANSAL